MAFEDTVSVLKAEIEAALASRFRWLRFDLQLEARYEAETGAARCRHLIVSGLTALVLYNAFLISDWRLVPDVFRTAVLVRTGIVTPIALLIVALLLRNPSPAIRETSQALISIIVSGSVLYLMLISASPLRIYHHYGVVLVILFATVVQRIHFGYAVAAAAGSLLIYVLAIYSVGGIPDEARLSAAMVMLGAAVFTLIAGYRLEHQQRMTYLLRLRDRLRHEELDLMTKVDPLTGLANRREMDRRLDELWHPAVDSESPVCLLLLDIDHFKAYNDEYGHPAGDLCLKRVAGIVAGKLRGPDDLAIRFGGEELLVLLGNADLHDGVRIAERMRRAIEEEGIPHAASGAGEVVTVSIGVASVLPAGAVRADELISSADSALYAAKRNGRNQVWPPLLRDSGKVADQEGQVVQLARRSSTAREG